MGVKQGVENWTARLEPETGESGRGSRGLEQCGDREGGVESMCEGLGIAVVLRIREGGEL
jgi:hypothetical protein